MTNATVRLWGKDIGAVSWIEERGVGVPMSKTGCNMPIKQALPKAWQLLSIE